MHSHVHLSTHSTSIRAAWQTCFWFCLSIAALCNGLQEGEQAHCLCSLAHYTQGKKHMMTHKAQFHGEHRGGWSETHGRTQDCPAAIRGKPRQEAAAAKKASGIKAYLQVKGTQSRSQMISCSVCLLKGMDCTASHCTLFPVMAGLWLQGQSWGPSPLQKPSILAEENAGRRPWMLQSNQRLQFLYTSYQCSLLSCIRKRNFDHRSGYLSTVEEMLPGPCRVCICTTGHHC